MPVQLTVIWFSPGVVAAETAGAVAGRAAQAVAGHCPGELPAGNDADAT
jgi:hypothetical protein